MHFKKPIFGTVAVGVALVSLPSVALADSQTLTGTSNSPQREWLSPTPQTNMDCGFSVTETPVRSKEYAEHDTTDPVTGIETARWSGSVVVTLRSQFKTITVNAGGPGSEVAQTTGPNAGAYTADVQGPQVWSFGPLSSANLNMPEGFYLFKGNTHIVVNSSNVATSLTNNGTITDLCPLLSE